MAGCKRCGIAEDAENLTDGHCSICDAEVHGRKPTYTLPRDEWDAMSREDRVRARADGITPEPPVPLKYDCPPLE
jgi:hypothetical protein